ncbi:DUF2691 family protein [Clostridium sp. YIM B02551]|uniref:DUF2691 family protein n=1 Tax=Clostridium sp. YIM B02551 TaxID=2910679 RepID=UPI001EEA5D79|nr:DUF2691 family protein [Clostridium sp. YIM B02551]
MEGQLIMGSHGITFEIPNAHGSYLADILMGMPFSNFKWLIDNDEIHMIEDNEFTGEFLYNEEIISGDKLFDIAANNTYYMIFVTLRAFLNESDVQSVSTYREFLESSCEIAFGVYDCSEVIFWSKGEQLVSKMYNYCLSKGYNKVKYISEDDLIKGIYHIE